MQEPITRSVQLPYSACETAFSQVELFLDIIAFTQIPLQRSDIFIFFYTSVLAIRSPTFYKKTGIFFRIVANLFMQWYATRCNQNALYCGKSGFK